MKVVLLIKTYKMSQYMAFYKMLEFSYTIGDGHFDVLGGQILILGYMFICESCSTHQDVQNKLLRDVLRFNNIICDILFKFTYIRGSIFLVFLRFSDVLFKFSNISGTFMVIVT